MGGKNHEKREAENLQQENGEREGGCSDGWRSVGLGGRRERKFTPFICSNRSGQRERDPFLWASPETDPAAKSTGVGTPDDGGRLPPREKPATSLTGERERESERKHRTTEAPDDGLGSVGITGRRTGQRWNHRTTDDGRRSTEKNQICTGREI
jgi:hypothetical protein